MNKKQKTKIEKIPEKEPIPTEEVRGPESQIQNSPETDALVKLLNFKIQSKDTTINVLRKRLGEERALRVSVEKGFNSLRVDRKKEEKNFLDELQQLGKNKRFDGELRKKARELYRGLVDYQKASPSNFLFDEPDFHHEFNSSFNGVLPNGKPTSFT